MRKRGLLSPRVAAKPEQLRQYAATVSRADDTTHSSR
jgi:hypothetical protein